MLGIKNNKTILQFYILECTAKVTEKMTFKQRLESNEQMKEAFGRRAAQAEGKGSERGICLVCYRNSKAASKAGGQSAKGRTESEVRKVHGDTDCVEP